MRATHSCRYVLLYSLGASALEDWDDQASDSLMALGMRPWVKASQLTESTVVTGVPKEDLADVA